jgi:hypothetical protein
MSLNDLNGNPFPELRIGTPVLYFNYDRIPHAAIVAWVRREHSEHVDRPFCNLASFAHTGHHRFAKNVAPAWYDTEIGKWHLMGHWAFYDEVPEDEYNHLMPIYHESGGEHDSGKIDAPPRLNHRKNV